MHDIFRLFRKGNVYSQTSSIIFQLAPGVYFATLLMAILFVPFGNEPGLISFNGDFVFFAYTLALGKFLMIIAALDTGSSFEGMGASREALFSMLVEPAFFILMGSLALLTGYTSFAGIFGALHFGSYISYGIGLLASFVFITIALIENSRMPVDDPKTHLELTMIHEVMILDHSGPDLAFLTYAYAVKLFVLGAVLSSFIAPPAHGWRGLAVLLAGEAAVALVIGVIESTMARLRLSRVPQLLVGASVISAIGVLVLSGGGRP
jgi:formate hydrogenlyase subunit 4